MSLLLLTVTLRGVSNKQNRTEQNTTFIQQNFPGHTQVAYGKKVIHIHNNVMTLQNRPHCLLRGSTKMEQREREREREREKEREMFGVSITRLLHVSTTKDKQLSPL